MLILFCLGATPGNALVLLQPQCSVENLGNAQGTKHSEGIELESDANKASAITLHCLFASIDAVLAKVAVIIIAE